MDRKLVQAFAGGMLIVAIILLIIQLMKPNDDLELAKAVMDQNDISYMTKTEKEEMERKLAELTEENNRLSKEISEKTPAEKTADNDKVKENEEKKEEAAKVKVEIKEGMNLSDIADLLKEKKLIKDTNEFIKYVMKNGKEKGIQIGSFEMNTDMDFNEIIDKITR